MTLIELNNETKQKNTFFVNDLNIALSIEKLYNHKNKFWTLIFEIENEDLIMPNIVLEEGYNLLRNYTSLNLLVPDVRLALTSISKDFRDFDGLENNAYLAFFNKGEYEETYS